MYTLQGIIALHNERREEPFIKLQFTVLSQQNLVQILKLVYIKKKNNKNGIIQILYKKKEILIRYKKRVKYFIQTFCSLKMINFLIIKASF